MAQTGYTPILIYGSTTASSVPLAANLTTSASGVELAINAADGKLYFKNSSGVVTLLAGAGGAGIVAGSNTQLQFNNSGVFGASANLTWDGSKVTASAYQTGGNLTFTGTGNRITGDFSNATEANRVAIQTSTTNGGTRVNIISNGTGTASSLDVFGVSDPTNAAVMRIRQSGLESQIQASITGTGTYLPMTFYTSGTEKLRIAADATGTYTFGGTAPRITGDFSNATVASRVAFQTSTANSSTAIPILPNGTSTNAQLQIYNNSDPTNGSFLQLASLVSSVNIYSSIQGTGTYLPMTFYTGGSERMRLDTSGNVGVGTSSPTQTAANRTVLSVNGTTTAIVNLNAGGVNKSYFYFDGTNTNLNTTTGNLTLQNDSANSVTFNTNGANERMRIDSSGNVGIGTSSPTYRLSVAGANNTGIASFSGNNNGVLPGSDGDGTLVIGSNYAAGSAEVDYFHNNSTYKGTIGGHRFLQRTGASTSRDLMWLTENLATFYTGGSERMRIDSSGNVGIGTSSPLGKLKVGVGNNAPAASGNMNTGVIFEASNAARAINIGVNNTAGYSWINAAFANNSGIADNLVLMTGATERVRIDSSGRMLINLTTSKVYGSQLQVVNTIQAIGNSSADSPSCVAYDYNALDASPTYSSAILRKFGSTATGNLYFASTVAAAGWAEIGGINVQGGVAFGTNSSVPIIFTTTGIERMRIDSSGNVGIGTNSTGGFRVAVVGPVASSVPLYLHSDATATYVYSPSSVSYFGTTAAYAINFVTNNTIRATIDSSGLVSTTGNIYVATGQTGSLQLNGGAGFTQVVAYGSATDVALSLYAKGSASVSFNTNNGVLQLSAAGLGYGTGSGGTVTQGAGSGKATAVTLNKPTGQITMNNAALAANTTVVFTVTNSLCAFVDTVSMNHRNGANYNVWVVPGIGSFDVYLKNITAGSLSDAVVLNFAIIKGATA